MKLAILISYVLLTLCSSLRAEKHALLIGISNYNPSSNVPNLDGPKYDISALRELLTAKFGFPAANVKVLQDDNATFDHILAELNNLKNRVKPGDYVLFYYSGHGTSFGDPAARTWGLDPNTGALIPYDIHIGTAAEVRAKLIVGKEHLRPIFTALDSVATVLAIFDTCYSADAAKSIRVQRSRYVSPSQLITGSTRAVRSTDDLDADAQTMAAHQDQSPYPYRHVISLAAAGKFQPAGDISLEDLRRSPNLTFDHQPHGVMTNALLAGLSGAADKNHDGVVSHDELYSYLLESSVNWSHKPVLQAAPDAGNLLAKAALAPDRSTAVAADAAAAPDVCVAAQGIDAEMVARLKTLHRIHLADNCAAGLLVRPAKDGGFDLYQASGVAITEQASTADQLLARVAAEPDVQDLLNLSFHQSFNVDLRMAPDDRSVYTDGATLTFTARTEAPAHLLLLNIDITGAVTVVYPFHEATGSQEAGVYHQLGKPDPITPPFGIEYMKLFAFSEKPADLDHWKTADNEGFKVLEPGSAEFRRLMLMLRSLPAKSAETRLRLVTAPGKTN
jgi:hypothetical protein